MTTSSTEPRVTYAGNGSTTTLPITFAYLDSTEILVTLITDSTNNAVTQTITTDYTVDGSDNVEMVTAPASGETVVIELNTAKTQSTNYVAGDAFPAETHEAALDKLARQIKELKAIIDYRVPKLPVNILTGTTVTDTDIVADKVFKVNSAGTGLELGSVTTSSIAIDSGTSAGAVDSAGEIFMDTDGDASTVQQGVLVSHDGTQQMNYWGTDAYPTTDDQVLAYDSASNKLTWQTLVTPGGISSMIDDTTPQLGGDLDTNAFDIQFDDATGIRDDSDNEQLIFQKTASAVNYLEVTNAATGNGPSITVNGSDANADLTIDTLGTGSLGLGSADTTAVNVNTALTADVTITVDGSASSAGSIRLAEDTDNGTNYMGFKAPAAVTSSLELELPDGDGSANQILETDGAGVLSWVANSGGGKIVQIVNTQTGTTATGSTAMPFDNTIPQITEGTEFMTLAITPTSATNKLLIQVVCVVQDSGNTANGISTALFQDSTANALAATSTDAYGDNSFMHSAVINHYMTSGTTSATTFRVRSGLSSGTVRFNGAGAGQIYGGVASSSITITEISV